MHTLSQLALAALATVPWMVTPQSQAPAGPHEPALHAPATPSRFFALTTDDQTSGALLDVRGGPPWQVSTIAATAGATRLRRFGADLYQVHPSAGTVARTPIAGGLTQTFDLGPSSQPQDVLVAQDGATPVAWVTRRSDPLLFKIDLQSGVGAEAVDLGPVGGGAAIELGTLERDGTHLFVQVKVPVARAVDQDAGLLAVVDLATETLVDVDPVQPGVQGIALQGAPPRFPMQIVDETRTLFVSATEGYLDGRGAIEMIDLDTLTSIGLALSEQQIADLGGFVMTSPSAGWFVFHTDLAASTHLKRFTLQGGPDPGPEVLVLLGDQIDTLAHDAGAGRVYLPSRFAGGPVGVYAIDTATKTIVGTGPIPTGPRPHDVVAAP